jgi:hypothetical protein
MTILAKDAYRIRRWAKTNPGLPAELREYFTLVDQLFQADKAWPTTTTTTTTTTTSSTTTTTTA